jgi:hypothetical protein
MSFIIKGEWIGNTPEEIGVAFLVTPVLAPPLAGLPKWELWEIENRVPTNIESP